MKKYSIGFMTYVHRYESHFVPLFAELCRQRPDVEKVVFFNGQHKEKFHTEYRRKCLEEMSKYDNTFVHMSPVFRSFSHMVNTNINISSKENILILNDDNVASSSFLDDYENALQEQTGSFLINRSFSHFSINKKDIIEVGYFDERLLGIGEEDGEWDFRYAKHHNIPENGGGMLTPSVSVNSLSHRCVYDTNECKNMKKVSGKYSTYNREFICSNILNKVII